MADVSANNGTEDLRAAVASGLLSEAQAASLRALAQDRAGRRARLPSEDEPFEFFRGFSEIFVSVGLIILMAGLGGLLVWISAGALLVAVPAAAAAVAWWWAGYFTLRRRMNLPSMVLAVAFAVGVGISVTTALALGDAPWRLAFVGAALVTAGALALWYRRFRLPFSMFLMGLAVLAALYGIVADAGSLSEATMGARGALFDLRDSPRFGLTTLVFGIASFAAAMWFDLKDPYRLGRHAATGFWLHMLAAPALVNTVAMTLYNFGGSTGIWATSAALVVIGALALIIDRRSFVTAAILYLALVLSWVIGGEDGGFLEGITLMLVLGMIVTGLGTWWVQLRAGLLRALPGFPGKDRLPPWG